MTGQTSQQKQQQAIGEKEIAKAVEVLKKYKDGKTNLEKTIVENEKWYKLRHWDVFKGTNNNGKREPGDERPEPASAWLFNSLANKHADAMDNYPEPNVLPREEGDKKDAEMLSSIIPAILERNDFESTYSDAWWYKLKHGVVPYGVFWNTTLENGLGDIDIKQLDILNIFWEPGITDIQDSRNLFICSLVDDDLLKQNYPQLKGKSTGKVIDVTQYVYDDTVDISDKSVVVDWYYKKTVDGKTILHFCKFVGNEVLFATENNMPQYENGWYSHGQYPVVFDVLFPEAGTPVGFGYLGIMKDPQMYIDKLSQVILENAVMNAKVRYFMKEGTGVNESEFLDWSKPIVHVAGSVDQERLVPISVPTMPGNVMNVLEMKIDELKETSSNRDVSQGSSSGGVTAAAAIAALQEAGNKTSRDMISAAYRAYTKINYMIIELIRQFYDINRSFRIIGQDGAYRYVTYNNHSIQGQPIAPNYQGEEQMPGYSPATRVPIFDIMIKPQKRSAYSRMAQNELAKELYSLGLFEPERAQPASICLEMMDFDGDDEVRQKVQQGQTLINIINQMTQQLNILSAENAALKGIPIPQTSVMESNAPNGGRPTAEQRSNQMASSQKAAMNNTMTPYGEKLAQRSKPDMNENRRKSN
nr:MAG TPA: portal protein [Caudoviricetes sp.]